MCRGRGKNYELGTSPSFSAHFLLKNTLLPLKSDTQDLIFFPEKGVLYLGEGLPGDRKCAEAGGPAGNLQAAERAAELQEQEEEGARQKARPATLARPGGPLSTCGRSRGWLGDTPIVPI